MTKFVKKFLRFFDQKPSYVFLKPYKGRSASSVMKFLCFSFFGGHRPACIRIRIPNQGSADPIKSESGSETLLLRTGGMVQIRNTVRKKYPQNLQQLNVTYVTMQ